MAQPDQVLFEKNRVIKPPIIGSVVTFDHRPNYQPNPHYPHYVTYRKPSLSDLQSAWLEDPLIPAFGASIDNARVIIVEFFDYQCPYCRRIYEPLIRTVKAEKDVRLLFLEMPILGPISRKAAQTALAAHRQDQYLPFHAALMGLKQRINPMNLNTIAKHIGLDVDQLKQDRQSPDINRHIDETLDIASRLGIRGTPAFLFGDYLVPGGISEKDMLYLIDKIRQANR